MVMFDVVLSERGDVGMSVKRGAVKFKYAF